MKHNGATRTLLQLIDGVFPIFDLYTVYIDAAATTKRPLLSPGAAHNHRAATERSPESADEIGCAARSGGRSGWRPFMMNGEEDGTHRQRQKELGSLSKTLLVQKQEVPSRPWSILFT